MSEEQNLKAGSQQLKADTNRQLDVPRASETLLNSVFHASRITHHASLSFTTPNTQHPTPSLRLRREHVEAMKAHAQEANPVECCGLIGSVSEGRARAVYRLRNVARDPLVAYEAAPEDLFAAQRLMRERGESLLGIYHSHPRSSEPQPSETDVRLAYYPEAIYFIIGLDGTSATLRAFRLSESAGSWERVEYGVVDE
jgi:proteasome lid subunit RPN8/RPN11